MRTLGRGAMGVVYEAQDPEIERRVAIKMVRADLLEGAERQDYVERFRREAQAAGRCNHPAIVVIYDFALHEGNPFLAMEYVEGLGLDQALAQHQRFTPTAAVQVMLQVLEALACAHALGIVHRDIKPANILLMTGGRVKVMDFGIARVDRSDLTGVGTTIGSLGYMSPEQCGGGDVDARSDLFSTATVLQEMLIGQLPFPGRTFTEIAYKLVNEPPAYGAELAGVAGPDLTLVLHRALAKRPQDRFADADAMADALRQAIGGSESRTALLGATDKTVLMVRARSPGAQSLNRLAVSVCDPMRRPLLDANKYNYRHPLAMGRLNMPERTGKCTRFGNCSKADTGAEVTIPDGADPLCPECGKELLVNSQGSGPARPIGGVIALVVIALLVVAALGFGGMKLFGSHPPPPVATVTPAPAAPAQIQPPPPLPVARVEPTPPPLPPAVAPVYEDMVRVADFWIDKTEVSIGEFKAKSAGYKAPKGFTDDLPVVDVSWEDARRFAEKSGKRLCKESEWLFALGEVTDPSGANLSGATMDRPRPVGDERDSNGNGLLNMVGNVSEWVDPGTDEAAFAGGYWYWNQAGRPASELKSVQRLATKRNHHHYIGFRSCRDAEPASN